jgi:hypothetical protein
MNRDLIENKQINGGITVALPLERKIFGDPSNEI